MCYEDILKQTHQYWLISLDVRSDTNAFLVFSSVGVMVEVSRSYEHNHGSSFLLSVTVCMNSFCVEI